MHLRRVLLLFAVVLAGTAIVSALAPRRRDAAIQPPAPPPQPPAAATTRAVRLDYPPRAPASTVRLTAGEHLELEVRAGVPGEASAFGMVESAEALTPASFDVLVPGAGRYPVTFRPIAGAPARLATFEVGRRLAVLSESGRRP